MSRRGAFWAGILTLWSATACFGAEAGIGATTRALTGGETFQTTGGGKDVNAPTTKGRSLSNEETAIYNHLLLAERGGEGTPQDAKKEAAAFDVLKARCVATAKRKALESKVAEARKKKEEEKTLVKFAKGYCYLHNDVIVERIATYAYLDCDFPPPIGRASLAVSMTPEFYAKALIASPLYVTKGDLRLPVLNGVVMTKDRNSINVANVVNDRLLQKILATGAYRGIGVAAQQAQAYLDAYQQSLKQEQSIVVGGNNPVVTTSTNNEKPKASLYLAMAGVQFVSEMAKILGENFVRELPYTFKANKGSIYYVDLQFAPGTHMRGYRVPSTDIVKREPEFDNGLLRDREAIDPVMIDSGERKGVAPPVVNIPVTPPSAPQPQGRPGSSLPTLPKP